MSSKILVSDMRMIDPLNLEPGDIRAEVAIHGISMQNRYGGHTVVPYTVAEHTCHLIDVVPAHLKRAAAIHEYTEGLGFTDLVNPLKLAMPEYGAHETAALKRIFQRFNEPWEHMEELHTYDRRICADEMLQVFAKPWFIDLEPLGVQVFCWPWHVARENLLHKTRELGIIC